jgi:4-carboxymuconolactone decarboxylase
MSRVPHLLPEDMNDAQRQICQAILGSRGGKWFHGPYDALLLQPRLAAPAQQLGEFVRLRTSLAPGLIEISILVVARHWRCEVEWYQHAPLAAARGLTEADIDAIRHGTIPPTLNETDMVVHDFTHALLRDKRVGEALYTRTRELLGTVGVVELTGLIGYYTFLALTLNAHEIELPAGATPMF